MRGGLGVWEVGGDGGRSRGVESVRGRQGRSQGAAGSAPPYPAEI